MVQFICIMIELIQGAWALETRFFNQVSHMVFNLLANGKEIPKSLISDDRIKPFEGKNQITAGITAEFSKSLGTTIYTLDSDIRVASVPVFGTLTKYGGLCSYGSEELSDMINEIDSDKSIDAAFIHANGPGGSVSGITRFADTIYNSEKLNLSFVEETAASAHLWSISQTPYIIMNSNEYSQIGSIGVLTIMVNESEMLKKEGLKIEILRADQSTDKARLNSIEEWREEDIKEQKAQLTAIAEDFIDAFKRGRGDKLQTDIEEDIFTGKMYSTSDAIKYGMADYSDNLVAAIEMAAILSKTQIHNNK